MTAGGESIQEQLRRLLGLEATKDRQAASKVPARVPLAARPPDSRAKAGAKEPSEDSWKQGVKPLRRLDHSPFVARPDQRQEHGVGGRRSTRPVNRVIQKSAAKVPLPVRPAVKQAPSLLQVLPPRRSVFHSSLKWFKSPEAWVERGRDLQPWPPTRNVPLTVRLGIDFGTAFTKVAIRVAGQVYFLDWDGLSSGDTRYLLGGEVTEFADGSAVVGRAPNAKRVATYLKLPFVGMELPPSHIDLAQATVFVAWTMRYARAWLYKHHPQVIRGPKLVWEANLGAPTGSVRQGDRLLEQYQRIGLAAWKLSQEPTISLALATKILATTQSAEFCDGLDRLDVVPEFMAQVAGYIKSPQRTDGLYLLMDVGAGTLDVACFRLHADKEKKHDSLSLYESQVGPLGAHYLMQVREHLLELPAVAWNGTDKVPTQAAFAEMTGKTLQEVKSADQQFEKLVERAVSRVISKSRAHMDRAAKEWRDGLPVFVAGGGADLEPYHLGLLAGCRFERSTPVVRRFPVVRGIEADFRIDAEAHSRLSVAYGLTFDADSIAELKLAQESWDSFGWRATSEGPDRDELYPK